MIREIATGLCMDDSMPEGCVDLTTDRRCRVFTAGVITAKGLIGTGAWGQLHDMLCQAPDGRYAVPELTTPSSGMPYVDEDEVAELRRGLELAEQGYSRICVHPPCILTASRAHDGYSLCEYHDDLLTSVEQRDVTLI